MPGHHPDGVTPIRDNPGLVTVTSSHDYGTTLSRLTDALAARGLTVFAEIDHAEGAREAGMQLRDEVLVVFGNPRAGTPLMQEDARVGIELPLRMLVWDSGDGILLGYNDPRGLTAAYRIGAHAEILAAMASLLEAIAGEAAGDVMS